MSVCQTNKMACIGVPKGVDSHCPIHKKHPEYRPGQKENWDTVPKKLYPPMPWDDK